MVLFMEISRISNSPEMDTKKTPATESVSKETKAVGLVGIVANVFLFIIN